MARNVSDLALLLSVMAGPTPRVPLALETPGSAFAPPLEGDLRGVSFAVSLDLGGAFEVDHDVAAVLDAQREVLTDAGAHVADAHPDLHDAEDTFRTLRAWHMQAKLGKLLAANPGKFKASLEDNIRAGEPLTGADVARAYTQRTAIGERMREFFEVYDFLVLPVSQVPPFSADLEYPTAINGREQATYLDWMRSAYFITVTGCPAISVPAGFTPDGLPVGIQVVAPHSGERRLLEVAHAFEQLTRVGDRRPTFPGREAVTS
jgi:amidase